MTNYIQRLMTATREQLEAPVKSAVKEAIADAHAHNVSTVGTRNGQVVLVRPSGEAVAYPERKKRAESPAKVKPEPKNETRYVLLKRRGRNAIYRQVHDALDQAHDLAAAAVGKLAGLKEAQQGVGGGHYARLLRDPATGQFITEEKMKRRYKLRKGDVLTVHARQVFTPGGIVDFTQGHVFHVDTDDMGPSIMRDDRYLGLPVTVGQGGVKAAERGYASGFGPKSTKKKSAPRKGRYIERG